MPATALTLATRSHRGLGMSVDATTYDQWTHRPADDLAYAIDRERRVGPRGPLIAPMGLWLGALAAEPAPPPGGGPVPSTPSGATAPLYTQAQAFTIARQSFVWGAVAGVVGVGAIGGIVWLVSRFAGRRKGRSNPRRTRARRRGRR